MRRSRLRVVCASLALAAVAACATAGEEQSPSTPSAENDSGSSIVPDDGSAPTDGSNPDVADVIDAAPSDTTCSVDGWCITSLPDANLRLVDVWPFADRSFALAESPSLGVKVLEWDGTSWSYIDDATQNDFPGVETNIWAPTADDVYFAISDSGTYGAWIYRGTRPTAPASAWTWTRRKFDCDRADDSPQVWGTSKNDVYVLTCGAIHHLTSFDDDTSVPAYLDDDTDHPLELFGASGTSTDDIWFVGTRGWTPGQCTVIVRKTSAGYERIIDGIPRSDYYNCDPKDGYPMVGGSMRGGLVSLSQGSLLGLRYSDSAGNGLLKIAAKNDGTYEVATSKPPSAMAVNLRSFWGTSESDLWLVSTRGGGGGVLHGTNVWADNGTYEYSTLALDNAPNFQPLQRIRGTSNANLWAVGDDRAFHKTTP